MAKPRSMNSRSYPSPFFYLLSISPFSSLVSTPKKSQRIKRSLLQSSTSSSFSVLLLCFLFLSVFFSMILILSTINISRSSNRHCSVCSPVSSLTSSSSSSSSSSSPSSRMLLASLSAIFSDYGDESKPRLSLSEMVPLPARGISSNMSEEETLFWKQPDNEGYEPCLDFSIEYRKESPGIISSDKTRFLLVVASGGLNQQRNQIVDAVVIARILKATLVVPILKVNFIWGDESEFSDIFDVEHFKRTLQADVRIVSSLPFRHLIARQSVETQIPYDVSPLWIRTRFAKQLNEEGVLVLKGLDSKLSKNLPLDLQKLRCKVAFHALRFAAPIRELGNRLARRMWIEGPYIAIHLRVEKDVWIRTGCQTGLGPAFDREIRIERSTRPEYLTGRLNISYPQRRLAGLCPLNAFEVARLLKALGAPKNARIYVAGGEPYGGSEALKPLVRNFPNLVNKEILASKEELLPFANSSSSLAAIDYIVSLSSDVFLPSHGGNMGRAMQGHRAYTGHRKYIKPNKRMMLPFFEDESLSDEKFGAIIRKLHEKSQGQPESRTGRRDRDVIAYPVPECMCNNHQSSASFSWTR